MSANWIVLTGFSLMFGWLVIVPMYGQITEASANLFDLTPNTDFSAKFVKAP